jgi:hypothetical protein
MRSRVRPGVVERRAQRDGRGGALGGVRLRVLHGLPELRVGEAPRAVVTVALRRAQRVDPGRGVVVREGGQHRVAGGLSGVRAGLLDAREDRPLPRRAGVVRAQRTLVPRRREAHVHLLDLAVGEGDAHALDHGVNLRDAREGDHPFAPEPSQHQGVVAHDELRADAAQHHREDRPHHQQREDLGGRDHPLEPRGVGDDHHAREGPGQPRGEAATRRGSPRESG